MILSLSALAIVVPIAMAWGSMGQYGDVDNAARKVIACFHVETLEGLRQGEAAHDDMVNKLLVDALDHHFLVPSHVRGHVVDRWSELMTTIEKDRASVGLSELLDASCASEPQLALDWSLPAIDAAVDDVAIVVQLDDQLTAPRFGVFWNSAYFFSIQSLVKSGGANGVFCSTFASMGFVNKISGNR